MSKKKSEKSVVPQQYQRMIKRNKETSNKREAYGRPVISILEVA